MATSSSTNFLQTRNEIISDALRLIGKLGVGDSLDANDADFCSSMLNKMIKAWQGQGIHLWREQEGTLFLRDGVSEYTLSSTSTDQAGDNVVETTLSAAEAVAQTVLSVTSTTGISVSDNVGIELDDGTRQWTTVSSVGASTITVADALTGAAASGNTVFAYTNQTGKPMQVTSARLRNADGTDIVLTILGRKEFMEIANKTTEGTPVQAYISFLATSAQVYLWPVPNDINERVKFSYVRAVQDFDSGSDDPDFPSEWLEALTFNLAIRIAPAYGIQIKSQNPDLYDLAVSSLLNMQLWNGEESSVRIVPNDE
jgi:hypothetical protein